MGTYLKLKGVTLTNPAAPYLVTEPFGVKGITHRYEASSFTGAVGSTIATDWPNLVPGGLAATVQGTPKVITVASQTGGSAMTAVDMAANSAQFVLAVAPASATIAAVFATHNTGYRIARAAKRLVEVGATGWTLKADTATGSSLTIPFTTVPRAVGGVIAVATLSADGLTDSLTIVSAGKSATVTGAVTLGSSTSVLLGPSVGSNTGVDAVCYGIWQTALTSTQVSNSIVPTLAKRFGVLTP